ncbi:MAG TPA: hypothetical protein VJX67_21625, partial [Blastocatellia bacterium]|nr:hypothetical protein [Blastocatellia bacterium]
MLFKNSFRSRGTWLELGAGLVVSVFVLALDLGISILIGVMVYWSYHHQIFVPLLTTVLGVLLAAWHLLPVLTASFSNDLNVSKFRLYPISISKLFAIDLSLGLFDPVTLVLIPPLLAIFIASALRSASSIPIAGFALLIFFIFNLGLSRYVQRLIGTLLASRRRKELFLLLIFLLIMLPQTLVVMGQRESPRARPSYQFQSDAAIKERFEKVKAVAKYLAWVPPGLAAISIGEDRGMHFGRQALSILLALMFTCAALGLEHRALDRDYYGKVSGIQLLVARIRAALGGSAVPGPRSGLKIRGGGGEIAGSATQTAVGQPKSLPSVLERLFPWLAPASIAIFEKDIKYIYRSPRAILMFVAPIIGSLIFVVPGSPLASGSVGAQYRLAGLVLYALVLGSQFF